MSEKRHGDLLEALRTHAFVRDSAEIPIIQSERTGEHGLWLFDFRALMLQPKWLDRYAEIFWEIYASRYPFQIGAMETAGISLVAAIVMKGVQHGTPVNGFFIRKSRKRLGLMKQIEGTLTEEPIILVDDLMNTGSTFEKQLLILSETGKRVSDVCAILAFRDKAAYALLEQSGVHVRSIFTLEDLGMPLLKPDAPLPYTLEELWRFRAPHPSFHLVVHKSAPALDDRRVFFGTDSGTFYALDQESGAVVWQYEIAGHPAGKGILSSPVVHGSVVYFGAYDGTVYALDTATGAPCWKYEDADWVGSSPALAPEKHMLFIGLEFGLIKKRGGIVALDMKTGKKIWSATHPSLTHGSPLYIPNESLVIIGSNDGLLYAYDALSGEERWRCRSDGEIMMSPAYDAQRRLVIFCSMDGNIYAVRADDGIPVFAYQTGGGLYAAPVVRDGIVYAASLDKVVYAINLDTGKDVWKFSTTGRIFASPAIENDSLWIGSNDGILYELDPASGKRRSVFQASERIIAKIAYSVPHHRLYFVTVANELYCMKRVQPADTAGGLN